MSRNFRHRARSKHIDGAYGAFGGETPVARVVGVGIAKYEYIISFYTILTLNTQHLRQSRRLVDCSAVH
jgi:hypothetical protein